MSLYSRLDRIAADVARLDRQLTSVSNHPQSQRTSVEGGSIDFNDDDGNLMAIVGSQDDGGNTINVISGPTPPTPVGFTVDVDHGKFIVHWSGDFDGDALAPSDWSRAEVHASQDPFFVPDRATARGSIVSAAGGEVTIGVLKGPWTIKMLAWSQAGKMSAPSAPVDVEVPGYGDIVLEEIDAANTEIKNGNSILVNAQDTLGGKLDSAFGQLDGINDDLSNLDDAVQGAIASANGKNTVHFDDRAPTAADEGVAGDTWFVGQVGRPNDVVQATNLWLGSALSQDRSAVVTNSWNDGVAQTSEGLEITIGTTSNSSTSVSYTAGGFRVPMDAGKAYSFGVPIKNSGSVSFSAKVSFYFGAGGGSYPAPVIINPGDTYVFKAEGLTRSTADDVRWSLRYDSGDLVPPRGARITLLDKATCVQSEVLPELFSGDTPSGESDNDPHYRWTGTPHASTSEKYLPATDGLSDKWNVTEQYRHDGTGWVQVELSHSVISSVDIGALTAGSAAIKEAVIEKLFAEVVVQRMSIAEEFIGENAILTGAVTAPKITASEELWAKIAEFVKIRAEHIEADAIDGMVVTGATIRTSGGSGEWSDAGLRINAPSGESLVNFPTNGEPLSLNADNTTIRSASISELESGDTSLTAGSTFTLESGQLAYPRAPEVRADWYPSATFTRPDVEYPHDWLGLAAWGDKWVRTVNVLGSAGESLDSIEVYDSDGIHEKTIYLDINPRHGVAVIGDVAYVMGPDKIARPGPEKNWVHGFNLNTGNRVTRWEFTRNVTNRFGTGTDGTNMVFAAVGASGPLYVTRFNPTSGASAGPDLIATDWVKYTNDVEGVAISGNILWVSHREAVRKFTISGSTITYTGTGWVNPNKNGNGIDMSKGWPFVVTSSGNLFEGSVFTSDPTIVEAGVTFRDNAGHETDMSQTSTVSLAPRECAAISIPSRPGLTTRVYYRQGVGQWQWWDATEGAKRFWVDFIPGTSVADPPSSNTFPNSDPSVVQAVAGPFVVRGDGSGRWGPLTFNADGTMTSTAIPAWVPVTTFLNGCKPASFGNVPAYRIWPDGKVEWRGVVDISTNGIAVTTPIITVPTAARPAKAVYTGGTANAGEAGWVRIDVCDPGALTALRVVPVSELKWASLDTISYYLT